MSNGRFSAHQNCVQMIPGYDIVEPYPGSFWYLYNQVSPKPILCYPHANTKINLMSVLQTREWILNLGFCLGWAFKDCWDNAISFYEKQIDGTQLVIMDVKDLGFIKKLGHRIDIVRAVKALKHRANVMQHNEEKYAGHLGNGSQTFSNPSMNRSSPFTNGTIFSNTASNEHAFVNSHRIGSHSSKYHMRRPSARNPRSYIAKRRLLVWEGKSLKSEITTYIEKGSVVTVNMLKSGRARIVKFTPNGMCEKIGWVSTHSDTYEEQLAPCK